MSSSSCGSIQKGSMINFKWPFPDFTKEQSLWKFRSRYCCLMVGLAGKAVLSLMNCPKMLNAKVLQDAITKRPKGVPLITVSNHESCMDDPGLIGLLLSASELANQKQMRWALAAHDICYTRPIYSAFFSHGKCIPVIRGNGVYQKAIDFAIERLNLDGDWVHIFPEGRVNMERDELPRLKWGVGRIIAECERTPIVIPFWHTGMESVLPNYPPYIPRIAKNVLMNVGQPLDIEPILESVRDKSALDKRKIITDFIQAEMAKLRLETLDLTEKRRRS